MNYCPYCGVRLRSLVDSEPNFCPMCGVRLIKRIKYGLNRIQCAICHEYVEINAKKIICSFCGSTFHVSCVHRWILQYNSCPLCQNIYIIPKSQRRVP